jgi:hypothetical protein
MTQLGMPLTIAAPTPAPPDHCAPTRPYQFVIGQLRSPLEVGEAMQARCQPTADGDPDVNAHYF